MKCAEVQTQLPATLGASALPSDIQEHLETCPVCQKVMDEHAMVWTRLDSLSQEEMPEFQVPTAVVEDLRAIDLAGHRRGMVWLAVVVVILVTSRKVSWSHLLALPLMQGPIVTLVLFGVSLLALMAGMRLTRLVRWKGVTVLGLCALALTLHLILSPSVGSSASGAAYEWGKGAVCTLGGALAALPVVLACAWSLRGARLPSSLSAALIGSSSGLFGVGVLHYECSFEDTPFHLSVHHGGAALLVLLLVLGAAAIVSHLTLERSRRPLS